MMETVFWKILEVSLTTSVVLLPLFLLRAGLRRRYPARVLALLWTVLAVRLVIPVQPTLPDPPVQVSPATVQVRFTPDAAADTVVTDEGSTMIETAEPVESAPVTRWVTPAAAGTVETASVRTIYWGEIAGWIWLIGALLLFAGQLASYGRFLWGLRRTAQPVTDAQLRAIFDREREALGIRRSITLCTAVQVDSPMLCGLLHPMLVLPADGVEAGEADLIFRHELTHDRRHDLARKLVLIAARAVHWFNPLVWMLVRLAGEDIEMACDQAVVHDLDAQERRRYGACILTHLPVQATRRTALTTCFVGGKGQIKRRLTGLFDTQVKKRGIALLVVCALSAPLIGGCFAMSEGVDLAGIESAAAAWALDQRQSETASGDLTFVSEKITADAGGANVTQCYENAVGQVRKNWRVEMLPDGAGGWYIDYVHTAPTWIWTLEDFEARYGDPTGLPTLTEMQYYLSSQSDFCASPALAAQALFPDLDPMGWAKAVDGRMTYAFPTGQQIEVTFASQGAYWTPVSWRATRRQASNEDADGMRLTALRWAQAEADRDGYTQYRLLEPGAAASYRAARTETGTDMGLDGPAWVIGTSSPHVADYAVYPDTERQGAYLVYTWETTPSDPSSRELYWLPMTRTADGWQAAGEPTALGNTIYDLDTAQMLLGETPLALTGAAAQNQPEQFGTPEGVLENLLHLTGGTLTREGEEWVYTFQNGQAIALTLEQIVPMGWSPTGWRVVNETADRPADEETVLRDLNALAEAWIEVIRENGLDAQTAETLLGYPMQLVYADAQTGYTNPETERIPMDNLPMGAEAISFDVAADPETATVVLTAHLTGTPVGTPTQQITLTCGWARERPVVRYAETTVPLTDDPSDRRQTASDLTDLQPGSWQAQTGADLIDAARRTWYLFGGKFETIPGDTDTVLYRFADRTAVYFDGVNQGTDDEPAWIVQEVRPAPAQQTLSRGTVESLAVANQWAQAVCMKNGVGRYVVMDEAMRASFVAGQQSTYGAGWFWRIGWGSSPTARDWTVTLSEDGRQATVIYDLSDSSQHYRYAERLTLGEQDGQTVVTGCESLAASWDEGMTYARFRLLYECGLPLGQIDEAQLAEWSEWAPNRFAEMADPLEVLRMEYPVDDCTMTIESQTAQETRVRMAWADGTAIVVLTRSQAYPDCWLVSGLELK